MRALALVCLGMTLLTPGAGAETRGKPASTTTSAIQTSSTNLDARPAAYHVVATAGDRAKRSFAVQLERRLTDGELKRLATEIRNSDTAASAVVMFYLPGMKIGHGVWAHAFFPASEDTIGHSNPPDPRITIVGLSIADEERLVLEARRDNRNLIGAWLTAAPAPVGMLTLYREKGRLFGEYGLRDGRRFAEEIVETALPDGNWRYDRRDGGVGEHLLVSANGELELRDRDNVATRMQAIKREAGDFNLAVARANQAKLAAIKLPEKTDTKPTKSASNKETVFVTVGSATTTAGPATFSKAAPVDKAAKTKTALPVDTSAETNKLADVIFR
jgi:hypothetical protein